MTKLILISHGKLSEGMRVNGNKKGIFTRQHQPKDAAFTFQKRWESLPQNYKGE